MKLWFETRWDDLRTSFWFVPTLMVAAAVVLSLATIHLDRSTVGQGWNETLSWSFIRGPEGSRAVLAAIAGSTMTMTSVTFSITIVALQLASSQFGPRLLRNFVRDRGNQVSLGVFIATFTYSLLVLRTINGTESAQFVPHFSVTVGLLMVLACLAVFIYFIHHAASSIQAENIIAAVGRELDAAIVRLYPEAASPRPSNSVEPNLPDVERDSRAVEAPRSDYLQAVDVDRLVGLAASADVVILVAHRPGNFCYVGSDLARVSPASRCDDALADSIQQAFYLGPRRTHTQDIEFAIDQLVEIAVRTMPPGGNDPFTAMNCIDRLGASLSLLATRLIPSPRKLDDKDHLRVVVNISTIAGITDAAFHQLRQASRGNPPVTLRLLESIAAVALRTDDPEFLASLRRHADAIHRGGQETIQDEMDRKDVEERYREAFANAARPA